METIVIAKSLNNNALFEHKCLQNINKLYKYAGNCYDQQQFKDILDAAMVYSLQVLTDNIPISPMKPIPVKKPSTIKSLCILINILDVKNKTDTCRVRSAKSKRKAIKSRNTPYILKPK